MSNPLSAEDVPRTVVRPARVTGEQASLIGLINIALRQRRLILGLPIALTALLVGYATLKRTSYTAAASFMPQASVGIRAPLSGLAAQFGLALPVSEPGQSPVFYVDLLRSREILYAVVDAGYEFTVDGELRTGNLIDLYEVSGPTSELRRMRAALRLSKAMDVTLDRETGVVTVSVRARWAPLAQQISQRLLDLVNQFNLGRRRSQATDERRFIEGRLTEVRTELLDAELRLQRFMQRNREFRNSPELTFEHERLLREVSMRQSVFTSLSQAYEQARIDEVRNTPVITVLDAPVLPVRPDPRRRVQLAVIGFLLGGTIGILLALARHFVLSSSRTDPEEFAEFVTLSRMALEELRHPLGGRVRHARRTSGS